MSVWLLGFYVSLHALHHHADSTVSRSVELCPGTDPGHAATSVNGICPVCLFLTKYTAEPPGIPPGPAPGTENTGTPNGGPAVVILSLCCAAAAPRAPPR
jgi:hypothetical protein